MQAVRPARNTVEELVGQPVDRALTRGSQVRLTPGQRVRGKFSVRYCGAERPEGVTVRVLAT